MAKRLTKKTVTPLWFSPATPADSPVHVFDLQLCKNSCLNIIMISFQFIVLPSAIDTDDVIEAASYISLWESLLNKSSTLSELNSPASTSTYKEARKEFARSTLRASAITAAIEGRTAKHNKEIMGSSMFLRLVVSSWSMLRVSPKVADAESFWDFAVVACLARHIFEAYLNLFYIWFDQISEDEWRARLFLMQVHDARARIGIFHSRDLDTVPSEWGPPLRDRIARLESTAFFKALPGKKQRECLRGKKSMFLSQDEIVARADIQDQGLRSTYEFLSSHIHLLPLSHFRMDMQGRGKGSENDYDKAYMASALRYSATFLDRANTHILSSCPEISGKVDKFEKAPSSKLRALL